MDSLATLEILVALSNEFSLTLDDVPHEVFRDLGTLTAYIDTQPRRPARGGEGGVTASSRGGIGRSAHSRREGPARRGLGRGDGRREAPAGLPALRRRSSDLGGLVRWIAGVERLCGGVRPLRCSVASACPGESGDTFSADSFAAAAGWCPAPTARRAASRDPGGGWVARPRRARAGRIRAGLPATGSPAACWPGWPKNTPRFESSCRCSRAVRRTCRACCAGSSTPSRSCSRAATWGRSSIYGSGPAARLLNTVVRQAVCAFLDRSAPAGRQGILEVGAGTGGDERRGVARPLPAERVDYVFSGPVAVLPFRGRLAAFGTSASSGIAGSTSRPIPPSRASRASASTW